MNIIKRFATTIHASVDRTVADGTRQEKHIAELERRIKIWTKRATTVGETDRDKALECLQQRSDDQSQLDHANETLGRHKEMATRMRGKVASLEKRVLELQRQHTELQSRDTVSKATTQIDAIQHSPGINIDETFDRWEVSIREREIQNDYLDTDPHTPSSLDAKFTAEEQSAALNDELDALLESKE